MKYAALVRNLPSALGIWSVLAAAAYLGALLLLLWTPGPTQAAAAVAGTPLPSLHADLFPGTEWLHQGHTAETPAGDLENSECGGSGSGADDDSDVLLPCFDHPHVLPRNLLARAGKAPALQLAAVELRPPIV